MSHAMPSSNRSLWQQTARPARQWDRPAALEQADVCIIGGGLAGMTTALLLAEQGAAVVVLDAAEPGAAASGRNAGFVVPNLAQLDPDALVARLGEQAGQRLAQAVGQAGRGIFDLAAKYQIDCAAVTSGWIQPTAFAHQQDRLYQRFSQWQALGQQVEWLDKQAVSRMTGTSCFAAGWLDRSGGALHPLRYLYGLANAVQGLGGRIFANLPADRLVWQNNGWHISAGQTEIRAKKLVVCANLARAPLASQLGPRPLGLQIVQLATYPIKGSDAQRLAPGRQPVSDIRRDIFTFRLDAENRLITGGMAVWPWETMQAMARRMLGRLARYLGLAERPQAEFLWTGEAAVTPGFMPVIRQLGPAGWAGIACNGRGLAATYMLARDLAALVLAEQASEAATALPVTELDNKADRLVFGRSFGALAPLGKQLILWRGRQLDRLHGIQDYIFNSAHSNGAG